jgi:hypothetical protein
MTGGTSCFTKTGKQASQILICAWSARISLLVRVVLLKEAFYHYEGVDILYCI